MAKTAITCVITDLDDEKKVRAALGNLFSELFCYYLEGNKTQLFTNILMSCAAYFGRVVKEAEINLEDDPEDELA